MMRLVQSGLMYGGLVEVSTPALVARYNAALEKLTGRRTKLDSFYIDLSGFAPEIGNEFGDDTYLNPRGCNQQFILLTLDQMRAPLLKAYFTSYRMILRTFYEQNAAALFALTSRDAVSGELLESFHKLDREDELLDLRVITVAAETVGGHVSMAAHLERLIAEFRSRDDAWFDEALIGDMIALASAVGDVESTPLALVRGPYPLGNFHTTHFGGRYVFHSDDHTTLIRVTPGGRPLEAPNVTTLELSDGPGLAAFLDHEHLIQSIFAAPGLDAAALLRRRLDFVLVDHLCARGKMPDRATDAALRAAVHRELDDLPALFHALSKVLRRVEQGAKAIPLDPNDPAYFYTVRATPGPNRDLVNMLLAELTPIDLRQLFLCHKPAFYAAYATWSEAKRAYAVDVLRREYLPDKAGLRARLFGQDTVPETPVSETIGGGPRSARRGGS
jgi:hypothetical protein